MCFGLKTIQTKRQVNFAYTTKKKADAQSERVCDLRCRRVTHFIGGGSGVCVGRLKRVCNV